MIRARLVSPVVLALALIGCGGDGGDASESGGVNPVPVPLPSATATSTPPVAPAPTIAVTQTIVATFANPWAMVFLPDGRLLVTEKPGRLQLVTTDGRVASVAGVPAVVDAGQGGLLDVAIDPGFTTNRRVYLSYAEAGSGGAGLAVARGALTADGSALSDVRVIWRQDPKVSGDGHFGGRMAFAGDGRLFITAGDRQKGAPAQDLGQTLGKIVRIGADGSIPADNPFAGQAGAKAEIWSYGHRNPYGLVFAGDGRLFESEMGPEGGDEFNLIERGRNYGWPAVSEGNNYGGGAIPRHATDSRYAAPLTSWTPVIAPGGMIQYRGVRFTGWEGDFLLAGLTAQGLVRVRISDNSASEVARLSLGTRIREVEEGPDGAIWVLGDGASGRLIRLDPA